MSIEHDNGQDLIAQLHEHPMAEHLNRVDENTFRSLLLPLAIQVHKNEQPQTGHWVYHAGSVQKGVVVTDGLGNELFTTPSLYQSLSLKITADFGAMESAISQSRESGGTGAAQFEQHVNSASAVISTPRHLAAAPMQWATIFSRYGYKMAPVSGQDAPVALEAPVNHLNGTDELL